VRSLVRDLGDILGCGAHVTVLRRLWVDPFHQPRMFSFEELEVIAAGGQEALDAHLLPIESALSTYPTVELNESDSLRFSQGQPILLNAEPGKCLARATDGRLLAFAEVGEDGYLRTIRGFNLG
jgi:tRNA pseudouridine55 synthase